jgi:D-serine deaminase-like pyridoxal phosphate-dependent protein
MNNLEFHGKHKSEIETPALLLDMDAVERNIAAMAQFFAGRECKLRPHAKTHKLPIIARKQVEAEAIGVTCARLGEAELFLRSGIRSVLIANEIVDDSKIRRMVNLAGLGELIVCVDDYQNAQRISDAAVAAAGTMNVLIEVNVGLNRCGVSPGAEALDLARKVSNLPNLRFRGIMGYEGAIFVLDEDEKRRKCRTANELIVETRRLIEANGIPVEIVSAGGSNTYYLTGEFPGITEVQVGSYVTMDSRNRQYGLTFEQAMTVMTTVISRPEKDKVIIDAGMKSVSLDAGLPSFGVKGLSIIKLDEEHGRVQVDSDLIDLSPGDRLEIIPSHGCTTIPLHDHYLLTRGEYVEAIEEIRAY